MTTKRAFVVALAMVMAAASCSNVQDDSNGSPDSVEHEGITSRPEENPTAFEVLEEQTVNSAGSTLHTNDVKVVVPPDVSSSSATIRVREGIPDLETEMTGSVVEIEHSEPIQAPVHVEWDVSELNDVETATLKLMRWSPTDQLWLVEQQPFTVSDGVLSTEISDWSFWSWAADPSQEIQELLGRRIDPPICKDNLPDWVGTFNSPNADTSAAAILACIEDDVSDSSLITMRIANNRTFAQYVHLDADDGFAWNWEGDVPLGIPGSVHQATATVVNSSDRVLVPPLHTIAVGIRRPGTSSRSQFVGFSNDTSEATVFADVLAFAAGTVNLSKTGFENPLITVFFELVLECGLLGGARTKGNFESIVKSVVGIIKNCVLELVDDHSTLGRKFRQRVSERIVEYGTPEKASKALKANRGFHSLAGYLKLLKYYEIFAYLVDHAAEARVGRLQWGLTLDGQVQDPGAWSPTCDDPATDQRSWSRNWVPQPAFNGRPLRDFHEYDSFVSILTDATAPLAECGTDHIAAVRDLVSLPDETSTDVALGIFDGLLKVDQPVNSSTPEQTPTPGNGDHIPTADQEPGLPSFDFFESEFLNDYDGGFWYSGCSPGTPDSLPDGVWVGYVAEWGDASISFDLVCWYFVYDEQNGAAGFDAGNNNPSLRELRLSGDLQAFSPDVFRAEGDRSVGLVSIDEFRRLQRGPFDSPEPVVVAINGGVVTQIAIPINS